MTPVPADQVEHLHVLMMVSRGLGGFRSETDVMGDATIYHSLDLWPDIDQAGVNDADEPIAAPDLFYEHCAVTDHEVWPGPSWDDYRRYADTCVRLHIGGGKGARQRYLFSVQADAYHMQRPRYIPSFPGNPDEPWSAIPRASVQMGNQTLGADGWLYLVLPDNAEIDLTPRAADDHYTYSVNPTKH